MKSPNPIPTPIADPNRTPNRIPTNERTNGLTEKLDTCVNHLTSVTRAGGVEAFDTQPVSLADVLAAGIKGTGQRFERTRIGEREPIPYHVRAAVWLRDRGVCQKCQARDPKPWHLDHIVPWSAGGSDDSTNLRVLCERCNVDRSNYDDGTVFAKGAVTWWCHRCYGPDVEWTYAAGTSQGVYCPRHRHNIDGYAKRCGVERIYRWQIESDETPDWHRRAPVDDPAIRAYCAHCGTPGLTDVAL